MNKHSKHAGVALAAVVALLSASRAIAVPTEITIPDFAPLNNGFVGNGNNNAVGNFSLPGLGIAHEDNEVERVTGFQSFAGQGWDLEGMFKSGNYLYMVGGYDFLNGLTSGRPGDLFIKVGGLQPGGSPTSNTGNVLNGTYYNYTYAVDLSKTNYLPQLGSGSYVNAASFGSSANVYTLNANSTLNTATNDIFQSNPWRYQNNYSVQPGITRPFTNTNSGVASTSISYFTGLSSSTVASSLGVTFAGTSHNVLAIDLSFLGSLAPGTDVWYSYTMECGNDSLKGHEHVPDGGTSAILIGIGLGAIGLIKRKRRVA